jgi:hypothetical protein
LADRRLSPGENIEQWSLKKGREDISAYRDCSDPYRRVFEKWQKVDRWVAKTQSPLRKEVAAKEVR